MWPGSHVRIEIGGEHGSAVSENGLKRFEFQSPRPEDQEIIHRLDPARVKEESSGGKAPVDIGLLLHKKNIESIYDSWNNNQDAVTDGPEARKAVAIIKAMFESAKKNGAPVDVK
jgi:UDP-N-acetyl-2-amino-2-deoxyglucuronate dehydrogenase